jgi:hypothetical protein
LSLVVVSGGVATGDVVALLDDDRVSSFGVVADGVVTGIGVALLADH